MEDDDDVRKVICRALRTVGHDPIETRDGRAGLAALRRDEPDLVITDILMPHQEGIETIELIRQFSGVPIIAISGNPSGAAFTHLTDAQLMGADVTLRKPFGLDQLLAAVAELLEADSRSSDSAGA